MKKFVIALSAVVALITLTSLKPVSAPPKLYPELEAFFNSLNAKNYDPAHLQSLENIKYNISTSSMDYDDWNLVFYCSENTFRSQASQVFAQTLCYARKWKKMKIYSAGITSGEIDPKLVSFLKKIGYKVTESQKDGKKEFEVRFSDNAAPVFLFSKTLMDNSLPKKDITSVVVCDITKETDCSNLKTESSYIQLPFGKISTSDNDEKIETTIKSIATEMLYVTNK